MYDTPVLGAGTWTWSCQRQQQKARGEGLGRGLAKAELAEVEMPRCHSRMAVAQGEWGQPVCVERRAGGEGMRDLAAGVGWGRAAR